jgi:hypothetical protein
MGVSVIPIIKAAIITKKTDSLIKERMMPFLFALESKSKISSKTYAVSMGQRYQKYLLGLKIYFCNIIAFILEIYTFEPYYSCSVLFIRIMVVDR